VHIPIVDLLIASYNEVGDYESVDRYQRFRYWIHRREADQSSDVFVAAAVTFANWQLTAHNLDTGTATFAKLRDALDALEAASAAVRRDGLPNDPRLIDILNAEAQAYMNVALYMVDAEEEYLVSGQTLSEDYSDIVERRNLIIESFIRGKRALEHVVTQTDGSTDAVRHALAIANLGDWELAFDRSQSARELYQRAYHTMKAAGVPEGTVHSEFGHPRRLHRFSLEPIERVEDRAGDAGTGYVTASFTVAKSGKVRNISIVEASPVDNVRIVRQAKESLRETRFRPTITADGPIEAITTIRYVFPEVSI
jgi:hypothetical protein